MEEVRKNITLDAKDFIIFDITSFLGSFTKNLGMALMICLFGFTVWFYMNNHTHYWMMILCALPTLAYLSSIIYFIPKNARETFNISSYKGKKPLFVLTRDTLSVERNSGNISTIKLTDLLAAWEKGKYFYFFITKSNTLTIPKRLLSTEEVAFTKNVISKLPHKIRTNPFKIKPMQLLGTILTFVFVTFCISMIIWSFTQGGK